MKENLDRSTDLEEEDENCTPCLVEMFMLGEAEVTDILLVSSVLAGSLDLEEGVTMLPLPEGRGST